MAKLSKSINNNCMMELDYEEVAKLNSHKQVLYRCRYTLKLKIASIHNWYLVSAFIHI